MMPALAPGDRIPNFERPDRQGRLHVFYKQDFSKPPVFICLTRPDHPIARAVLADAVRPSALWNRVERFVLTGGRDVQEWTQECPFTVLHDEGPLLAHLTGESCQAPAVVFALDTNLRIIERVEATGESFNLVRSLQPIYDDRTDDAGQILHQPAPVLMIPRVFDPAFCNELIEQFEGNGGEPSGVSYVENGKTIWKTDASVKQRRDYYPENPAVLETIRSLIGRRVLPEIHKAFQFQVARHEPFKMVCYQSDPGGYFRPHRDNDSRAYAHRRFAMTINLNTGDYTGGDLHFPEYGPHGYEAERGGAIVFSCSLLHEARDVIAGKRYALLGFFFGEGDNTTAPS